MDKEYVTEGYTLMTDYLTENRIKTKHRNFLRRLERFYDNNQGKMLDGKEEQKYLELEKYFFTNIVPPTDNQQKASVEVLKIFTSKK